MGYGSKWFGAFAMTLISLGIYIVRRITIYRSEKKKL